MNKKIIFTALAILLATGWAENKTREHGLGLIYQDLRTVPGIIIDQTDGSRLSPRQYVDHSANMPPVGNQGGQGSCCAWAVAYYYKTYQEWLERGWSLTDTKHQFSPAFMYNHINGGVDQGSNFGDAMNLLRDMGCGTMYDFPYREWNHTAWPSESAYAHAIAYRCKQGYAILVNDDPSLNVLKQHVADGDNIVLGIWCYPNFDNIGSYHNTYCLADVYGSNEGGHAVCVVGYDDTMTTHDGVGALKIVNSWGIGWGAQGYFWMSYTAVKSAVTSQQEAVYLKDLQHYTPKLTVRFKVNHAKRFWVNVQVKYYPNWLKGFFNWSHAPQAAIPFPDNNIVLDLTDLLTYLNPYDTTTAELIVRDWLGDGVTGSIQYFSTTNYDWGTFSRSFGTPQNMPDTGSASVKCPMPEQKLQWQGFHRIPSHAGFSTMGGDMDSVYLYWVQPGYCGSRSPVLGDVDGDGRLEAMIGGTSTSLAALNAENGSTCWTTNVGTAYAPAIGDVDEDGKSEVVCAGNDSLCLYAFNGEDGSQQWYYPLSGYVETAPCLQDVDDDSRLEVAFGTSNGSIVCLNGDGSFHWLYTVGAQVFSAPCGGDVNADGRFEVVAAANNGRVYCLRGKTGDTVWTFLSGGPVQSSPCFADIDNDTVPEVMFGSNDGKLYALNGENGSVRWQYTADSGVVSSPVVADIDVDTRPEVVYVSLRGTVYAINGENGSLRWSYAIPAVVRSSPALARADADTRYEVIVGADNGLVYCLNAEDGTYRWSYNTGSPVASSPAVGDIELDGKVEVVIGSNNVYALNGTPNAVAENGPQKILRTRISCRPNPAQASVIIDYALARRSPVDLSIFDAAGRQVEVLVAAEQNAGSYRIFWDARAPGRPELPDGVYFYRLNADGQTLTGKIILCR